ncbi:MAG: cysteine desulfurase [Firmicutes bacterium]|nr:cysteine desulfurase [Bacillota bacterium]
MIYLDNAATTKPSKAAVDAMAHSAEIFGNPSSLHGLGLAAEKEIRAARKTIAERLGVDLKSVYFTSGGTEANNTVIFGAAEAKKKLGRRLITTKIEHPSVLEAFHRLESIGYDVVYLTPGEDGRISIDELQAAANAETTLISVMHVNNETGVIQPVDEIRAAVKDIAPNAVIHSDCVQSFGKLDVLPKKWGADFVTISAHKIHGFKGTGAFYAANTNALRPLIYGGEQQNEVRPGTENVGGILSFAAAAGECRANADRMRTLRLKFKDALAAAVPDIRFNGSDEYNSGSVLNASFVGLKAEVLLHALEAKGVYVSTGSACSSHKPQPSHVLQAMGLNKAEIDGALRFSFDADTTEDELTEAAQIIAAEAANIRRFM